jgi:NADH-quinone oxidoreductase subunit G
VNNGLLAAWQNGNTQGAWELGIHPSPDLRSLINPTGVLYVAGADPLADDAGLLGVLKQNAACLVVQELFLTETARAADVVLPALPFTHREGSYTSGERRVQRFYLAVPSRTEARADFTITAQIALRLGHTLEGRSAAQVFKRLADQIPAFEGLDYAALAETEPQYPLIGRQDLYYGGTSYDNHQGLGKTLALVMAAGPGVNLPEPFDSRPSRLPGAEGNRALAVVPVTRLYDQGTTLTPSRILQPRLTRACLLLGPADLDRLGLQVGETVQVSLDGRAYTLEVLLEEGAPAGVGLIPRSVGVPIHGPALAQVQRAPVMA